MNIIICLNINIIRSIRFSTLYISIQKKKKYQTEMDIISRKKYYVNATNDNPIALSYRSVYGTILIMVHYKINSLCVHYWFCYIWSSIRFTAFGKLWIIYSGYVDVDMCVWNWKVQKQHRFVGCWIIYSRKLATFRSLKPLKSQPLNYMFSLINFETEIILLMKFIGNFWTESFLITKLLVSVMFVVNLFLCQVC